ncbi:MAG TPA: HlyD family efflux transporter periplasmic adaptor subunit [Steroidobacteraceae bacterium]
MRDSGPLALFLLMLLAGCGGPADSGVALGTLERDRLELPAEASEPIIDLSVREGAAVATGQVLLRLDPAKAAAQRASLQAQAGIARHRLTELVHGPRAEEVLEARARLAGAESELLTEASEYTRQQELLAKNLTSPSAVDRQRALRDRAESARKEALAELTLLLKGTRVEELDQARAALDQAEAELRQYEISMERLTVRAPRAGVIEALPFKLGERPPAGAAVVVMLAEGAPYARVYVPQPVRSQIKAGMAAQVHVDGFAEPFSGEVRFISADAAFTPYYALTQKDRSRLSYLTEVVLTEPRAAALPTGITVEVGFPALSSALR